MAGMDKDQARQTAPLMLAYIGDAIIELMVRKRVMGQGPWRMDDANKRVVTYVRASAQASAFLMLEDRVSETDFAIARRGRNAKSGHVRKNADMTAYRLATGFEALAGYYELTGQVAALEAIMACLYRVVEGESDENS